MSKVTHSSADGVMTIVMDDGKANALNGELLGELEHAIDEAANLKEVIILAGRPGFFSGGLDLKTLPGLSPEALNATLITFCRVMLKLFNFPRPVVAAATGHAIAGGAVTLLTADVRIAARGAFKFGLTETQLGLTLPHFVVEIARTQLPPQNLHRIVIAGDSYDPETAHQLGLLDALVEPDQVMEAARAKARALSMLPWSAYAGNKAHVRGGVPDVLTDAEVDIFKLFLQDQG